MSKDGVRRQRPAQHSGTAVGFGVVVGATAGIAVTLSTIAAATADTGAGRAGWIVLGVVFLLIGMLQLRAAERTASSGPSDAELVDASLVPMLEVDLAGTILRANEGAVQLLGRSGDELAGSPLTTIVPERLHARYEELRQAYVGNPLPSSITGVELALSRADGTEVPVEILLAPVEDGPRTHVRAALIDVSERARLFEELQETARTLERSNAELQEFASIASHDLREPLRTLAGFAQLLEQRHADDLDDEGREYLGYITHSATRMQHLITDLLTYASVGQQPLRPGPVDTQELVAGTVRALGSAIEDVQAAVDVGSLPTVRGNASQLAQVFLNLVSNALKFRADDPLRVEISAERRGNQWWFSITDNGIGIEPQYGDRVFKMFQRLHTQEEYEGTGMGLTICQRVIERHGGTIWYEQPDPGGSAFRFTLPA